MISSQWKNLLHRNVDPHHLHFIELGRSTINTYIHLSILCYSLNSSQFELTNVNFVTNGLPYTAQPPRVRHVTTRTPSSFPLLASQRAGCIVNILPNFSFYEFLEALPRSRRILFQKHYSRTFVWMFSLSQICYGGRRNLRFIPILFVSKFRVFAAALSRPLAHFSAPVFPGRFGRAYCSFYARSLAAYSS